RMDVAEAGEVRLPQHRLSELVPFPQGVLAAAHEVVRRGEEVAGVAVLADGQGPFQVADGVVVAMLDEAQATALHPGLGAARIEGDGAVKGRRGLRIPA